MIRQPSPVHDAGRLTASPARCFLKIYVHVLQPVYGSIGCPRLPRRRAGNQVLARSGTAPCRSMATARATAVTITTTRKMTTLHNAMVAPAAVSWW